MDKATEKINILLRQKENWEHRLEYMKIECIKKEEELEKQNKKMEEIFNEQYDLEEEKKDLIKRNKKIDIEEEKSNNRFWVLFVVMNACLIMLLLTVAKPLIMLFVLTCVNLIFTPNLTILSGIQECKMEREYLKNNPIENIDEKILRNKKNIKLQREIISFIKKELTTSKENICNVENFIDIFEERIKEITDIRTKVINDFITNNQQLDNLIDNEYLEYKTKLTKK